LYKFSVESHSLESCPQKLFFLGDYEAAVMRGPSSICWFKAFSYFWNQTSEFYETLPVLFIGQ